jgi:hypothetical protein
MSVFRIVFMIGFLLALTMADLSLPLRVVEQSVRSLGLVVLCF